MPVTHCKVQPGDWAGTVTPAVRPKSNQLSYGDAQSFHKDKEHAGTCTQTHCDSGCWWQTPPQPPLEHPRGWGQGTGG